MDLFAEGFVHRALIATVLVGTAAPIVGSFAVQRGQSLIGDGVAHVAFAGFGLALLAGFAPLAGALLLAIAAAVFLHVLQQQGLAGDVALAVIFYAGIAAGYLFAAQAGQAGAGLLAILFGSPLTLAWNEVAIVGVLAGAASTVVFVLRGPLISLAFDPDAARVTGIRVQRLALTLTVLAALVVVGGMISVGALLVGALLVIPVAAAARLASSYVGTLAIAAALGGLSGLLGVVVAVLLDLPPGPAVVLVAVGLYALIGAFTKLRR